MQKNKTLLFLQVSTSYDNYMTQLKNLECAENVVSNKTSFNYLQQINEQIYEEETRKLEALSKSVIDNFYALTDKEINLLQDASYEKNLFLKIKMLLESYNKTCNILKNVKYTEEKGLFSLFPNELKADVLLIENDLEILRKQITECFENLTGENFSFDEYTDALCEKNKKHNPKVKVKSKQRWTKNKSEKPL